MYHINPACIKTILSRLPEEQFVLHARFIRRQAFISELGSSRRAMFFSLYSWCRVYYKKHHS